MKKQINTNIQKTKILSELPLYLAAFILPCLIALAALYCAQMYPFGDLTLAVWDLQITYVSFYGWLENVINNGGSLFYSFSKSLGGGMYPGWASLVASPLYFLSAFFGENPADFLTFMIITKFGAAGVTSCFFIRRRFKLNKTFSLILAICYAMMIFMTSNSANPMWMEAVILLPLVMYGLYCLVRQGKVLLFAFSLLLSIIFNYYNGYMLCLFSILYYLFESYLFVPEAQRVRAKIMVNPGRFSIAFTLTVAMSVVILLPTVIGLMGGKGAVPSDLFQIGFRYLSYDVARSFFFGVYEPEYLPLFYTGTITLICAVWYFANPKIEKREKVAVAIFLGFMVFCTWFNVTERIWLGFRDGNGFFGRFSFLISSLMLFAAARALNALSKETIKRLWQSSLAVGILALLIFTNKHYLEWGYFFATIGLCVLYPLILSLMCGVSLRRPLKIVLSVLLVGTVCIEAIVSTQGVFKTRTESSALSSYERYESYYQEGNAMIAAINEQDESSSGAFRFEKSNNILSPFYRISVNESMTFDYHGVALYDSTYDDRVQYTLSKLGYTPHAGIQTNYNNPVVVSDALLGIKYTVADKKPYGYSSANIPLTWDGEQAYQNTYALPLGYGASDQMLKQIEYNGNPFDYQNKFVNALTGHNSDCYIDVKTTLLEGGGSGDWTWEVEAPSDVLLFGYIECPFAVTHPSFQSSSLYIDDEYQMPYFEIWSQGIFPIELNEDGSQTISIKNQYPEEVFEGLELHVAYVDMDAFEKAIDLLSQQPFEISVFRDGYVEGSYTAIDDDLLLTTIPYDAGWTIKVDGVDVEPLMVQEAFIGIELEHGEHKIEMSYIAPGFFAGLSVSLISAFCFVVWCVLLYRNDGKKNSLSPQDRNKSLISDRK